MKRRISMVMLAAIAVLAVPARAGNTLVAPGVAVPVAKSDMVVTPAREWNRLGARSGANTETWTLDGDPLNALTFYGGIADGATLIREVSKRNKPLPHFSATMLPTDIPALLEQNYRIAFDTALMTIDNVTPGKLGGHAGVRFTYSFTLQGEDVARKGDAIAAIVGGKLYMITYQAPQVFYFDKDLTAARIVMDSAKL